MGITSNSLSEFDSILMSFLSEITNTCLVPSSPAWLQASLPVKFSGLGVRSAVDLAPSAFLASIYSTASLVHSILPSFPSPLLSPPFGDCMSIQKAWDQPRVEDTSKRLLESARNCADRARLLAASCSESGAWFNALPLSSIGLRLDDDSLRTAVDLRLGTPLCSPHKCRNCNQKVDSTGRHGLSCKYSKR